MTDGPVLPIQPAEADDADVAARIAARIAALYAATPQATAEQVDRCVRAVRAGSMPVPMRRAPFGVPATRWWWGAAAAAALLTATATPWRSLVSRMQADSTRVTAAVSAAMRGTVTSTSGGAVEFDVVLPTGAKHVAIVGDFNGWDAKASPMVRGRGGKAWSARIPLAPGRHTYAFVVDGERWIVDPLAPQVEDEGGYGPANALVLAAPSS